MSASSDTALLLCTASKWYGDPFACRWCNGGLPTRRHRWCSNQCANQFGREHWWTSAAPAAMQRDDATCVRCGAPGEQVHHKTPLHTLSLDAVTIVYPWRERRRVKHGDSGCWHHLDGLETLCASCHHAAHHPPRPEQLTLGAAADPSTVCGDCGETLGAGHLETCPRMPKIDEPAASEAPR